MENREPPPLQDNMIDVLGFWREMGQLARRRWKRIALISLVFGFVSGVYTMTMVPRAWSGRTNFFLGPLPTQGASLSLQRLFAGLMGGGAPTTLNVLPNELAVQILRSRTFTEQAVDHFDLMTVLELEDSKLQSVVKSVRESVLDVELSSEGMISLTIPLPGSPRVQQLGDLVSSDAADQRDEETRKLVADLSNYYVDLLREFLLTSTLDEVTTFLQSSRHSLDQVTEELEDARQASAALQLESEGPLASPEASGKLIEALLTLERDKTRTEVAIRSQASDIGQGDTFARIGSSSYEAYSPVLQYLQQKLSELQVEMDEKSEAFAREHPQILELNHRRQALLEEIAQEEHRLLNASRDRLNALDRQIDDTTSNLLGFTETHSLQRKTELELRIREAVYQAVAVQVKQAEMEAEGRGLRLKVVDTAISPDKKVRPSSVRNGFSGLILGFLVGIAQLWFHHTRERGALQTG